MKSIEIFQRKMSKSVIISHLTDLVNQRQSAGQHFRAKAYQKAIGIVESYSGEINCGNDLANIKGIGPKIVEAIDQALTRGTCEPDQKVDTIKLFKQIYGVGPKAAIKFYDDGFRTLNDLTDNIELLNDKQKIGLTYFHDLRQKINRSEIDQMKQLLSDRLDYNFDICGSYRRGLSKSGDVDVLIECNLDGRDDLIKTIKSFNEIVEFLAIGQTKIMAIYQLEQTAHRIDFRFVKQEEYIPALLYFTGSKNLNIQMRNKAIEKGWTLNEYSLTDKDGNRLDIHSEKDIFNFLEMDYLSPTDRNC